MLTNQPAIDWLTKTTWSKPLYETWCKLLEAYALEPLEAARRMQYEGVHANNVFCGEAHQRQGMHYMTQASGMEADLWYVETAAIPAKCTRLDLQLTVALPDGYNAARVAHNLRQWRGGGRKRKITLIQSGDGLDTVYIGSRTSRRFIRLYIKQGAGGGRYLRYEVEYKKELAADVDASIRAAADYQDKIAEILAYELRRVPGLEVVTGEMGAILNREAHAPRPRRQAGDTTTLAWLRTQVEPSIQRLMCDHDVGSYVRQMVRGWAGEADQIEETLSPFV